MKSTTAARLFVAVCLSALILRLATPQALNAKGARAGKVTSGKTSHAKAAKAGKTPKAPKQPAAKTSHASVPRDAKGQIQRSAAARHAFARQTGYPNGRPGYVIDHIKPLACGGADASSNMQWQTLADSKAKDRVERRGCW
jgi:hypothetical protein